ncbi:hypothetical protein [Allosphingosinicella vermicomposti]|uniref:hypothetical protein n=1 Tax=Allosphingosinicella vermicomposti TaxID=614671 RepID=UPI00131A5C62|nr:hypothetical protein [Allosphingosinicella vermicomposti]
MAAPDARAAMPCISLIGELRLAHREGALPFPLGQDRALFFYLLLARRRCGASGYAKSSSTYRTTGRLPGDAGYRQ